jgi:hypothetical protein
MARLHAPIHLSSEEVVVHSGSKVLIGVDDNSVLIVCKDFRQAAQASSNPFIQYNNNYTYCILNYYIFGDTVLKFSQTVLP